MAIEKKRFEAYCATKTSLICEIEDFYGIPGALTGLHWSNRDALLVLYYLCCHGGIVRGIENGE